jgi:hypothetical protein
MGGQFASNRAPKKRRIGLPRTSSEPAIDKGDDLVAHAPMVPVARCVTRVRAGMAPRKPGFRGDATALASDLTLAPTTLLAGNEVESLPCGQVRRHHKGNEPPIDTIIDLGYATDRWPLGIARNVVVAPRCGATLGFLEDLIIADHAVVLFAQSHRRKGHKRL